jgi:hypothetical protein
MQPTLPIWVEYIRALGTPIAAVIFGGVAAWISYRQWEISHYRYRFDLFDRRYKVYLAVQDTFSELMRNDAISGEILSKLSVAANEAKFLFGDDVDLYMSKVMDLLFDKKNIDRKFGRAGMSEDDFEKLSGQSDENWEAIFAQMKEAKSIFSKYLKVPK